jgi:hypothetical protein
VVVTGGVGAATVVWLVVVVVVVAGSFSTVVQELRMAAMAGTMQMRVSFFIQVVTRLMVDSLQVSFSDVSTLFSLTSRPCFVGLGTKQL